MEIERIDFWDSMKILAKDAGLDINDYQKDPEKQKIKSSEREKIKLLNKRAQAFFRQNFPSSKAENYALEKRFLSQETIEKFWLWYAPDSYYDQVTFLKDKWFSSQDIIWAGLAKNWKSGDAFAFFRHRLTFPIHDHIWNVVWFWGRALDADQNPKYLNTTETAVYEKSSILYWLDKAKSEIRTFDHLIVVEWYMDVIALSQYWLPIWIATCGTALTVQHTKLVSRHTQNLVFAFDQDWAGYEAAIRWLKVAYEQDLYPKILLFPKEYKDVDEWMSATVEKRNWFSDEEKEWYWKWVLKEKTQDGFDWVLASLPNHHDVENPVERKKATQILFELISKIEDYAVMQMYFWRIVNFLWVNEQMLRKQFRQRLKTRRHRPTSFEQVEEEKKTWSSRLVDEKYLLWVLLQSDFLENNQVNEERYEAYKNILTVLAEYFPTTVLAEVVWWDISSETREKLDEAELFWNQELSHISWEKITDALISFVHKQIYKLQRVVLKSKKLWTQEKQELLDLMRSL